MLIESGEDIFRGLFEKKRYTVLRFGKHLSKKSPDFQVVLQRNLLFYCEVKDINDLDNIYFEPDKTCPDDVSIILQKIYDANIQFRSVNPNHTIPNVLAFHCMRLGMDANDLHDAIFGYVETDSGSRIYRHHRGSVENRLFKCKLEIDAYLFHNDLIDRYSAIYIGPYGKKIQEMNLLELKAKWE